MISGRISTMTGNYLQRRDKKSMAVSVNLTQVISGLTVVKCYFANSFGRMSFEQKICLNYGATTMLGSKSYSMCLKSGDVWLYHYSRYIYNRGNSYCSVRH